MRFEVQICGMMLLTAVMGSLSRESVCAADWARFRGAQGAGVSSDDKPVPAEWSETKNLKWKAELPGPGASSPIVVGNRVFVTCWSGYADGQDGGSMENLKRHLVCIDRNTGKQLWSQAVDAVLPEEEYRGMFAENGYASHTPVSDGKHVFVFFGKSGVHAFDMEGTPLWKAEVGSSLHQWGTASSPILYKDLVIVTAGIEDRAILALDKETGKQVWRQEADGFGSTWGTPILINTGERDELVIGVPYEIWSLNPKTGKLFWYCEAVSSDYICSSALFHDGVIYVIDSGPRGGGAVAVRPGGKGDVTETHILWTGNDRSRVGTPVGHEGKIYWVNSGVANCLDAKTGESIYQARLESGADAGAREADGRQGGGNQGGRRFGGARGRDYSSPVIADGKLYYARRSGDVYVVKLGDKFEQLAKNRFKSSPGDYHATPAVSDGQLFIRSSRTLYCVAQSE